MKTVEPSGETMTILYLAINSLDVVNRIDKLTYRSWAVSLRVVMRGVFSKTTSHLRAELVQWRRPA